MFFGTTLKINPSPVPFILFHLPAQASRTTVAIYVFSLLTFFPLSVRGVHCGWNGYFVHVHLSPGSKGTPT